MRNHLVGVEQKEILLFSDFEEGGPMWSDSGPRLSRTPVQFSESFRAPPVVQLSMSMWDVDRGSNLRADISTDAITEQGFDILFRTWGDTQIARVRASWIALGELAHEDDWSLY